MAAFRWPNLVGKDKSWSNTISIIAFVVFAGGMLASYLYNKHQVSNLQSEAIPQGICDLRQAACSSVFPDGSKVSFEINPKTIPLLVPLALKVEVQGMGVSSVIVDFVGLNMDMGFNRSVLNSESNGRFEGEFIIPICINSRMEWEARVRLKTEKGTITAPFHFHTIK